MANLERAIAIAVKAHAGQIDRAGRPYILHPLRMMMRLDDASAQIVAILHDVIEDSPIGLDDLRNEGFDETIIKAIDCLTRRPDEPYEAFIARGAPNALARQVKLIDLEDNMDIRRLDVLTSADFERLQRYQNARHYLLTYATR